MFELMPYSGSRSMDRFRKQMDDLFGRILPAREWMPAVGGDFVPAVDVKETDEAIEVTAEVPGLKAEEIDVSLSGDLLIIKGEKKEEKEEEKGGYHLVERRFGSFQRSFRLPAEVDRDQVKADHKNGVLHLVLPKGKKQAAAKIEVKPS